MGTSGSVNYIQLIRYLGVGATCISVVCGKCTYTSNSSGKFLFALFYLSDDVSSYNLFRKAVQCAAPNVVQRNLVNTVTNGPKKFGPINEGFV